MENQNVISKLFDIEYPIVQGGMIWCSGWRLAAAVSEAGGLGLIGAGSMYPEVLREHIRQCKAATQKPFGVNVPLLYPDIEKLMQIIVEEGVKIVFTSAGNPATWTSFLQDKGITVVHVIANTKFALKAQQAGVNAIVAEGFEAGGHNGREETTTLCLIPMIRDAVTLPLIAAGGIGDGRAMLAAMALGADGVQVGSLFAASAESSAHEHFKQAIIAAKEGDTSLMLKKLTPVRLLKNEFADAVRVAENNGANAEELAALLGSRRAKRGIFEGEMNEGELEIGQVSAMIQDIKPAAQLVRELWDGYQRRRAELLG
ncbi:enoyl-[acyl-carrier protein] reductase II [Flexibacter flexilis DSM 6793]|uniref:Enoyl-[acyl-carrier protein] reductase II n=1 Tax=Flexibacter flexilis DSM 6793 TaxID=927664 RepID=A0A1I1DT29_9BACT|nr:nitronate monooxygenase [Flexibacter flexilis]SFB78105.1 enoyl-[acyl-carrier protein] reductase II [Flexibacter flexilis DSM 6793]